MSVPLRRRLRAGDKVYGAIVRLPNEDLVDMLGVAGLDFVLVDCEHGPADVTALRQHIVYAEAHGLAVLVRVGENEPGLVLRALDQGAQGVVIPHVDTAAEAAEAVATVHYPPLGRRGFATYTRAGGFGTTDPREHQTRLAEETLVLAMLESPTAVRNAGEILAVDGIDGYLVGTADLAASSSPDDPSVADSLETVRSVGRHQGSLRADIVNDTETAERALGDGAQLVVYNLAAVMMRTFAGLRVR
jgi:4-hydroxy-2-oxoheptanedioate aldolase